NFSPGMSQLLEDHYFRAVEKREIRTEEMIYQWLPERVKKSEAFYEAIKTQALAAFPRSQQIATDVHSFLHVPIFSRIAPRLSKDPDFCELVATSVINELRDTESEGSVSAENTSSRLADIDSGRIWGGQDFEDALAVRIESELEKGNLQCWKLL